MAEIDKARLIELAEAKLEDAKLLLGAGRAPMLTTSPDIQLS
jgi:hypothetical protein